jgi:hypothetical protein
MIGMAVLTLASRWNHSVQFATLFAVVAYIHGRWLPWRFTIRADGVDLVFPFGRRLFLPKHSVTIRIEVVGAIALVGRRRRFGYPLMDGILYVPNHDVVLRNAFMQRGYDVA